MVCAPMPAVLAEEVHVCQVFQNLIGNAIKYGGGNGHPPEVKVGAEPWERGHWRLWVADKGPGIDEQYREQIFEPFKRLHGDDVPGAGIGLATCRRIVERYGGKIWVESEVGAGSVFCFTLRGVDN